MGYNYRIISADGHTVEAPHIWDKYLPKKFADRAPRLVKDSEGGDAWELMRGQPPMTLGLVTNSGKWGRRYEDNKWTGFTYDTIRKGAFDGKERLIEQDIDGLDAEVLYPSQRTMAVFMAQPDDQFHVAGVEAYNTWLYDEFMAPNRDRLIGMAQMPGVGIDAAVRALKEAKRIGFKGVIISAFPSGNDEFSEADDPFFKVAEEEQMPIHIHSGVNQAGKRKAATNASVGKSVVLTATGGKAHLQLSGGTIGQASTLTSQMIFSGLFDRFPHLKVGLVECGAGWIPHFLENMDDHWWRNRVHADSTLKMLPSDYFRRNFFCTFIREPFAVRNRYDIGVKNMMWSSDYPHHRHDWPYSRRVIAETLAGVPAEEHHAMVCGNAVELYKLDQKA